MLALLAVALCIFGRILTIARWNGFAKTNKTANTTVDHVRGPQPEWGAGIMFSLRFSSIQLRFKKAN